MITATGYSKDQSIPPEGIVITFGKDMMNEQGGAKTFLQSFEKSMSEYEQGNYWMHKCSNLPTKEYDIIYIIVLNRLWAKAYCGGYRKWDPILGFKDDKGYYKMSGHSADGTEKEIDWSHLILSGPLEKCPFKRILKGFQGFRYCTKLF